MNGEGLLIIGWDRRMVPPDNINEIPPTKIAVEDVVNVDDLRVKQEK